MLPRTIILLILIAGIPDKQIAAQYILTDDDVVVVDGIITESSYAFPIGDIVMPDTLDGQLVIGIGHVNHSDYYPDPYWEGVFSDRYITGLKLPASIRFIADYAFLGNLISDLDLNACSALQSIGNGAFANNRLTSVDLSACIALTNIGHGAFEGNQVSGFALPVNLENMTMGWIDSNDSQLSGGDRVNDLESFYYVPITYTLTNEDVEVKDGVIRSCSYHFASRRLIIPDTLDGQPVLGFAEVNPLDYGMFWEIQGIFSRKGLEHVTFPSTIESIDKYAFSSNQLSGIDLSGCTNLKRIGFGAFEHNNLTSLDLRGCINLKTIDIASFWNNKLTSINFSQCTALTKIGEQAFESNELAGIDLGACRSLTAIGIYAFIGNENSDFVLPVNNEYGDFGWNDLDGNHYNGGDLVNNPETTYYVPVTYTITDEDVEVVEGIIQSCSYNFAFKSIIIPDTLDGQRVIGIAGRGSNNGIFRGKGIVHFVLPSAIEVIGEDAFAANHLRTLDLSPYQALICIGEYAFMDNKITSLNLSGCSSLTSIENAAFWEHRLTSVDLSGCTSLISIGSSAFRSDGWNGFSGFVLPENGLYSMYGWKATNGEKYSGGSLVSDLGEGYYVPVPYILTDEDVVVLDGMIQSCSYDDAYKHIIIPETLDGQRVTGISNDVFNDRGIESITLPSTLEVIGDCAFDWNTINALDFSACSALRIIGDGAFAHNNLDSIDLSACIELETIGGGAFAYNDVILNRILIDSCTALKSIGPYAFFNYENKIENIDLSSCAELRTIGEKAIWGCQTIQVDLSACHSLISLGKEAFAGGISERLVLPHNTEYDAYGWKDLKGTSYTGGSVVTDLENSYYIPVPYTLKDEDVEVVEGMIQSCSYDFTFRNIIIPDTLDGQPVNGIYDPENYRGVFYNCGMVATKFPSTLRLIEDRAFYSNNLSSVDLSACSALRTIGQDAFMENNLTQVNLSACSAITVIGNCAFFRQNEPCRLLLPMPELPGYLFHHWIDCCGNSYQGGASTTQLNTPYIAIFSGLTADYRITFMLLDGSAPLPGAEITLSGYGSRITDINGRAVFTDVLPMDEIGFTVTAEGYKDAGGVVSALDTDVMVHIEMDQVTIVSGKHAEKIRLYPNPAHSMVHVESFEDARVSIISLSGRTMLSQQVNPGCTSIRTDHLEPGLYLFTAETGDEIFTRKLIIR